MLKSKKDRMPKSYPPEFRRKVLDVLAAGRTVTEVAEDLGISGACIYNWRKQDRLDRGELLVDSRGIYGARRVHAELTIGMGIVVGHNAVEMLMRRAGLQGLPNKRRFRSKVQVATATDLVERSFARSEPAQLWVPTSPSTAPARARSTARSCWTCSPVGLSAGRSMQLRRRCW